MGRAHGFGGVARALKHGWTIGGSHARHRCCRSFYIRTGALRSVASRGRITAVAELGRGRPLLCLSCSWSTGNEWLRPDHARFCLGGRGGVWESDDYGWISLYAALWADR